MYTNVRGWVARKQRREAAGSCQIIIIRSKKLKWGYNKADAQNVKVKARFKFIRERHRVR